MTVDPATTREVMRTEIEQANLDQFDVEVEPDYENLTIRVSMTSPLDEEEYIAEFDCENYRNEPPKIVMIHPETGERDIPEAYFDDSTDLIATPNSGVVICIGFNRDAIERDDLHPDWTLAGWESEAKGYTRLGEMIGRLCMAIGNPDNYQGRFKPDD